MGGDYWQLLEKFPLANVIALLILVILRIVPIIIMAPFLGGRLLPTPTKVGFSVFLAILLLPFLVPLSMTDLTIGFPLVPLCLKELLIGTILGFLTTIPFNIVTTTGTIIDHQRGSSSLMVTDPSLTTQTSPIGTLFNQILLVSFFVIGGSHLFFETLIVSFQRIPPETFIATSSFNQNVFWKMIVELMGAFFSLAVRFAAPPLLAMLMADIFLGIANRLAPQVQIAFLGMPIKSLLGLILLFVGFNFILYYMDQEMLIWFKKLFDIFSFFPEPAPN